MSALGPGPRRLISIPAILGLWTLVVATLPLTALVAGVMDLPRGRNRRTLRGLTALLVFSTMEVIGTLCAIWLRLRYALRLGPEGGLEHSNRALQVWWGSTLFEGLVRVYSLKVVVTGVDEVPEGPVLVFIRHAGLADAILPIRFLQGDHSLALRYVLKEELLWDPCLDIAGNAMPNVFIKRGSGDPAAQVERVVALADGMKRGEGVLIYPEGTRYTPAKHARVIAKLREAKDPLAEDAAALRCTLPPKAGGPLALLQAVPDAPVLFMNNTGLEHATKAADLFGGRLTGKTIRVHYERADRSEVPTDGDRLRRWLLDRWSGIDAWVAEHQEP